jgi:hypothetical protein
MVFTFCSHLHGAVPSVGDAASLCLTKPGCDALDRVFSYVSCCTWLLGERQVYRRLIAANRTCGAPCIWASLLNDYWFWSVAPVTWSCCTNGRCPTHATHTCSHHCSPAIEQLATTAERRFFILVTWSCCTFQLLQNAFLLFG